MANLPLTGTWGKEKLEPASKNDVYRSTATEMFDLSAQKDTADMEHNKFAKFVRNPSIKYRFAITNRLLF